MWVRVVVRQHPMSWVTLQFGKTSKYIWMGKVRQAGFLMLARAHLTHGKWCIGHSEDHRKGKEDVGSNNHLSWYRGGLVDGHGTRVLFKEAFFLRYHAFIFRQEWIDGPHNQWVQCNYRYNDNKLSCHGKSRDHVLQLRCWENLMGLAILTPLWLSPATKGVSFVSHTEGTVHLRRS